MSSKYVSLHNHSEFSALDSVSKILNMVSRAKELGQNFLTITDHGTLGGIIQFYEECKEQHVGYGLGCEFYISDMDSLIKETKNRKNRHLIVLAKNYEGYKDLIWLNNQCAHGFYFNPRTSIDVVKNVGKKGNLIGMSACIGGIIASELFVDEKAASAQVDVEKCRELLKENWLQFGIAKAIEWNITFGGNFYLEIQDEGIPMQLVIKDCFREISKKSGIKIVATSDPHFVRPEDAIAHEIIICSQTKKTLVGREEARARGENILFSDNSGYFIKGYDDIKDKFTEEEIAMTLEIADQIEQYEIELSKPKLPVFPTPEGYSNVDDFVLDLCQKRLVQLKFDKKEEYVERLKYEFDVFKNAQINNISLNNYFLILWDIVKEVERMGSKAGVGRGSAAGCIISYLLGITRLDPIEYDLSFQRFFNTGRLSEGRVSLPDIDLDVSATIRGDIIAYLKNKWGENNVIQISTFGTLQPKAAIKEVFRARGIEFEKANVLTKVFPEEEIKHDDNAKYTIEDALRLSSEFREAMEPYKAELELAKKLEGVKKSRGVHAAGVLISSEDINTFLPISYDSKSKSYMCSYEMGDAEKLCVKVDILGLKLLTVFDLCQAKINELGIKEKVVEIQEEKDIIDMNEEKEIEMSEEKTSSFDEMVLNYFEKAGFSCRVYPWFVHCRKEDGKRLNIFVEDNSMNIFQNREESLDAFIDSSLSDNENYFVLTHNAKTEKVYTVKLQDIIDGKKEDILPFGKIIDGKIIKDSGEEK